MSLGKWAGRFALEIGFAPFVIFGMWQFGLVDWRFWALLALAGWLTFWVKRQVADQIAQGRN